MKHVLVNTKLTHRWGGRTSLLGVNELKRTGRNGQHLSPRAADRPAVLTMWVASAL